MSTKVMKSRDILRLIEQVKEQLRLKPRPLGETPRLVDEVRYMEVKDAER